MIARREQSMRTLQRMSAWAFLCVLLLPAQVFACPVCFGDEGSAEVEGARWAIMFLLGITGTVLSGIIAFVFHVRKRARMTLDGNVDMPSPN